MRPLALLLSGWAMLSPAATAAQDAAPPAPGSAAHGSYALPQRTLWVGEPFDLTFSWSVDWERFRNIDGDIEWSPDPLLAEDWSEPELVMPPGPGQRARIVYRTRALALQPGLVTIGRATQNMILQTGVTDHGDYQLAVTEPRRATGNDAQLRVRPLPPAPSGFSGAVGSFSLESEVSPRELQVGEALTWRVTLRGTGNWSQIPGLPARSVSRDFDLVGNPETERLPDGTLFASGMRETVTLIPRRAGTYRLGPVSLTVFDPELGRYVAVTAPAIEAEILPGPDGEGVDTAVPSGIAESAAGPDPLPDPLPPAAMPPGPVGMKAWALQGTLPLILLLTVWLALALRRAWRSDPFYAARIGHRRLGSAIAALAREAPPQEVAARLRDWQRATALRWGIGEAAPVADALARLPEWRRLWIEAERRLYASGGELPPDWPERAADMRQSAGRPPRFNFARILRPANLNPFAWTLALALMLPAPAIAAAIDSADPQSGREEFNHALELARQGSWEEAGPMAAIAWAREPRLPATQMLLRQADEAAPMPTAADGGMVRPWQLSGRVAGHFSAREWQRLSLACMWLAGLSAAAFLLACHAGLKKMWRRGAAAAALCGVAGMIWTGAAFLALGPIAHPDAAILREASPLRPLPVDSLEAADTELPRGSVGIVRSRFLEWYQLHLPNGETGWVRGEKLIRFWSAPAGEE